MPGAGPAAPAGPGARTGGRPGDGLGVRLGGAPGVRLGDGPGVRIGAGPVLRVGAGTTTAAGDALTGQAAEGPARVPGNPADDRAGDRADNRADNRAGNRAPDRAYDRADDRTTLRLRETGPDEPPRYAPEWLRLREGADAAARAHDLLDPLRIRLANLPRSSRGLVVHDVGCGTGSMGRWLAPLLDGAQHWILHDRDPCLLHFAAVGAPRSAADGSRVTVETRRGDIVRLTPDALHGASLVTASALLDVLTAEEAGTLAAACAGAGCPALLTLSVAGRVELTPAHPLDAEITEAFNAHQRRDGLLGPDAATVAADAFTAHGATVRLAPSLWRLGPADAALTAQWLRGWVGAAVEQRPGLRERADRYLTERLAVCDAGELRVVVHHHDLLALCRPTGAAA
ncbi:hypothetical protein ACLGIH_05435 [Streptomyces sp. HMX87]|uniref:hypothetical protein n=1 Tax=Streptomyces sp. HMX87 TaxID=3390849 RepID=UPI003A8510FF